MQFPVESKTEVKVKCLTNQFGLLKINHSLLNLKIKLL